MLSLKVLLDQFWPPLFPWYKRLVGCAVAARDLLCCHLSMWVVLSSFLVGCWVPGKIALTRDFPIKIYIQAFSQGVT